jgi:putative tricarboxylic transport membrane protein
MARWGSALARGFTLLVAAVGALGALEAWRAMPLGTAAEPGAGFMPLVLGLLLATLGVAAALATSLAHVAPLARARTLAAAAVIVAWPLALSRLGFAVTTILALLVLGRVVDEARWSRLLAFSVVLTAASVLVFRVLLRVPLPVGPWGL